MAFTAAELDNIANSALDYFLNKGDYWMQAIQKKPFVAAMEKNAKTFPGGKGNISVAVKGATGAAGVNDQLQGFTHDDSVNFYNPANMKRAAYPWREMHLGLSVTHTELKMDGLSVTNTTTGEGTSSHSGRDMHVLVNLFQSKLEDLAEQYAYSLNRLFWGDGTSDPKALAGIRALLTTTPTTGVVGGIDRATSAWWRNRSAIGGSAIVSNVANGGNLLQFLQAEFRQLTRYGGTPDTCFCGSDFLGALEMETRANGLYSMSGFSGTQNNAAMGGFVLPGGAKVVYDPTLDDLGTPKRMYWIDTSAIFLEKMEGEWKRTHHPARPENKFVLYRSITCTGQLVARQLNSSGVYDIA